MKILIYRVRIYNIFSMYIISSFSHSVAREVKGVISLLKIWKVRLIWQSCPYSETQWKNWFFHPILWFNIWCPFTMQLDRLYSLKRALRLSHLPSTRDAKLISYIQNFRFYTQLQKTCVPRKVSQRAGFINETFIINISVMEMRENKGIDNLKQMKY